MVFSKNRNSCQWFWPTPRVINQGNNMYIAHDGSSYMVIEDPEIVDKFGMPMLRNWQENMADVPPFQNSGELTLVATWEIKLVATDDHAIVVYRKETGDSYSYFSTITDNRFTMQLSRKLYVYTSWSEQSTTAQLVFYDSNGRTYERMTDRHVQTLTHQGFPIGLQPLDSERTQWKDKGVWELNCFYTKQTKHESYVKSDKSRQ